MGTTFITTKRLPEEKARRPVGKKTSSIRGSTRSRKTKMPPDPKAEAIAAFYERERQDRRRIEVISPALEVMAARWPTFFDLKQIVIRPLANDTADVLCGDMPQFPQALVRDALLWITDIEEYKLAVAAGGPRYGLNREIRGIVTPQEMA